MEHYKLPAGRLATIFYRAEPKDMTLGTRPQCLEEGKRHKLKEDMPPRSNGPSTKAPFREVSSHNGRTLVWKNLTLDLKLNGENKRLLDGLSGE